MNQLSDFLFKYASKAVAAGTLALVASLGENMLDGNLTGTEAVASVGVGLVAAAGAYAVKRTLAANPLSK